MSPSFTDPTLRHLSELLTDPNGVVYEMERFPTTVMSAPASNDEVLPSILEKEGHQESETAQTLVTRNRRKTDAA